MYLREMGSVSLLTREGEVEIAKRIEEGERDVAGVILNTPITVKEVLQLGEKLRKFQISASEISKEVEEEVLSRMKRISPNSACWRSSTPSPRWTVNWAPTTRRMKKPLQPPKEGAGKKVRRAQGAPGRSAQFTASERSPYQQGRGSLKESLSRLTGRCARCRIWRR
jgi:hypothetical protein